MGIIDVQEGVVLPADPRVGREIRRVAGHRVDPVHAHQSGHAGRERAQRRLEVPEVVRPHPMDRGASGPRHHAPLVDGLVGLGVDDHGPLAGQGRDHGQVDQRDGRKQQGVGCTEQVGQPVLDVDVGAGTPEEPRPTRVGAPTPEVRHHRLDDLRVQVEAQVVAGCEVAEPVVTDPDTTALYLLDDGVHHRVARPLNRVRSAVAATHRSSHPSTWRRRGL